MLHKLYTNNIEHVANINNKCLLILYGESFRSGTQHTRVRDTDESFETQKMAVDSHIKLCDYLKENYNLHTDIIINTYTTRFENEIRQWYEKYLINIIINPELIGFENLVNNAVNSITDRTQYDFVLFMRIDVYIKPYFLEIFNPRMNKINFISQNYTMCNGNDMCCGFYSTFVPVVNPTITFIPKFYFVKLTDGICVNHHAWKFYKEKYDYNVNDMDFILDTYHDADSYKDFNPAYKLVCREESTIWHDKDFGKINKDLIGTPESLTWCKK